MTKSEVESCKKKLIKAILESREVQRFEKAKENIGQKEEKRRQIDEFRRDCFLMQNSESPIDILDLMDEQMKERLRIRRDEEVAEYLDSELDVCRMLQRICISVIKSVDLEIEGFEDSIET